MLDSKIYRLGAIHYKFMLEKDSLSVNFLLMNTNLDEDSRRFLLRIRCKYNNYVSVHKIMLF